MLERRKRKIKDTILGYLFLSPVLLGILIFTALPIILSFVVSFTNYNNIKVSEILWFENYINMFKNELFVKSIKNTFVYACISIPFSLFFSFFLAYLLNTKLKGMKVFRALIYIPVIIPTVAGGLVFADMFNPTFGIINGILNSVGLPSCPFLSSEKTAMMSLIIFSIWGLGGSLLIWLAAFNGIEPVLYESASLEGASWYHNLWYITLPLSTPIIFYNLILGIIGSMQAFGQMYVISNGGPNGATTTMVMMIYRHGLNYFEMGMASAMAWFLFAIIGIMTFISFKTNKWVHYEN